MIKEISVRRRIQNLFNKREDDFPSLRDYNDYLEEVEDIIFNLVEGVDIQKTEEMIARYQEENAEQIVASRARKAEEQAAALRIEQGAPVATASPPPAPAQVVAHNAQVGGGQYAPTMPGAGMYVQPRPAGQPVPLGPTSCNGGPEDEEAQRLREERGAKAGGWIPELGRRRAFEEAFMSMWVN